MLENCCSSLTAFRGAPLLPQLAMLHLGVCLDIIGLKKIVDFGRKDTPVAMLPKPLSLKCSIISVQSTFSNFSASNRSVSEEKLLQTFEGSEILVKMLTNVVSVFFGNILLYKSFFEALFSINNFQIQSKNGKCK